MATSTRNNCLFLLTHPFNFVTIPFRVASNVMTIGNPGRADGISEIAGS
ncbi:hypothetical protein L611_000400000120 [Aminobacter sp. J15]|nr:hypothetical protein L611_000400000120 [Aminobacter sp. J15]